MEETTNTPKFLQDYNSFMDEYKKGLTDGERVGEVIARMAQYFAMANAEFANSLNSFNLIASAIEQTEINDKPIASAKAKVLSAATPEHSRKVITEKNIESIEQILNALKSLQKGVLNEYAHVGNM